MHTTQSTATATAPPSTLDTALQHFPTLSAATALGRVQYRHAGQGAPGDATHVLLHGIGSGSASWVAQLQAASAAPLSVLAWDAPGYGESAPVESAQPVATDYAQRVWAWLDTLGISHPVTLVGHSLGAIMATSAARMAPHRVQRLVLLAPARGYANAAQAEREARLQDRLHNLRTLGPAGMAEKRGAAMLSPNASPDHIAFIQRVMAQIDPAGYTQATYLLANGNLLADLAQCQCPITVASGSADTITPASACREVATAAPAPWHNLGAVGHACGLEAATAVNQLLGLPTGDSL